MKNKKLAVIVSSIAVIALIGGTYAAFTASTTTKHKVSTKELGIELKQEKGDENHSLKAEDLNGFGDAETTRGVRYKGMPGDVVEEKVWVENTKTEPCFIRVTVNRSWMKQNADGGFEKTFEDGIDPAKIEIISDDEWYMVTDPDDSEILYFYYKEAVLGGMPTTRVMNSFSILKESGGEENGNSNAYAGLAANIIFEAEAVQSAGAEAAMLAEWGVVAEISDNQLNGAPKFQ